MVPLVPPHPVPALIIQRCQHKLCENEQPSHDHHQYPCPYSCYHCRSSVMMGVLEQFSGEFPSELGQETKNPVRSPTLIQVHYCTDCVPRLSQYCLVDFFVCVFFCRHCGTCRTQCQGLTHNVVSILYCIRYLNCTQLPLVK